MTDIHEKEINPNPNTGDPLKRFQITAGIILAILLIIIGILVVNTLNKDNENERLSNELEESLQISQELRVEYDSALVKLDAIELENEDLKLIISENKAMLGAQKARIESLIQNSRDLTEARIQLKALIAQKEKFLNELKKLQEENEELTTANENLNEEKKKLSSNLEESRTKNKELTSEKNKLADDKEKLTAEKDKLSEKVNRASVIQTTAIRTNGQIDKGEGKWKDNDKAKKIARLLICFDIEANPIAENSSETFYLRIINPQGETLAIENMGSGVLTRKEDNQKVRYTAVETVDYNQQESEVCMAWAPGISFQEGLYQIEVYNKGFLAGKTSYQLK